MTIRYTIVSKMSFMFLFSCSFELEKYSNLCIGFCLGRFSLDVYTLCALLCVSFDQKGSLTSAPVEESLGSGKNPARRGVSVTFVGCCVQPWLGDTARLWPP